MEKKKKIDIPDLAGPGHVCLCKWSFQLLGTAPGGNISCRSGGQGWGSTSLCPCTDLGRAGMKVRAAVGHLQ